MGIQTTLPASWETCMQVKKQQLELDMEQWTGSKLGKGYFYAEYITQNARLDKAQAGIKISGRNINNLRHADDPTLMAESKELKSLLMKVKEESENAGLILYIQKMKIIASGLITSWQIDGGKMETVTDYFLGLQNHRRWWLQLALWKGSYDKPRPHIKKQRHHFANKGPYSQSYGFSSSHVQRVGP